MPNHLHALTLRRADGPCICMPPCSTSLQCCMITSCAALEADACKV